MLARLRSDPHHRVAMVMRASGSALLCCCRSCRARLAHAGGLPMTDPLLLALSRAGMPPGAPSQQRGGAASTPLDGRPRGRDQEAASHVAPVDDFCSMLEQLEQRRGLPLSADHCALCGDGDASLLDLEALLPEQQCQEDAHDVLAGHQSDESGCSISSRVSLRSAQAPALPAGCLHQHSQAAFQGGSSELGSGPHTVLPSVLEAGSMGQQELRMAGDADLCNFLAEACSGLASEAGTSQQQFGLGPADPIMRSGSASSCSHCLASAPSGAPSLQRPLLPGPGNAGSDPGGKRKRGRPRRYDTVLPMLPGEGLHPNVRYARRKQMCPGILDLHAMRAVKSTGLCMTPESNGLLHALS